MITITPHTPQRRHCAIMRRAGEPLRCACLSRGTRSPREDGLVRDALSPDTLSPREDDCPRDMLSPREVGLELVAFSPREDGLPEAPSPREDDLSRGARSPREAGLVRDAFSPREVDFSRGARSPREDESLKEDSSCEDSSRKERRFPCCAVRLDRASDSRVRPVVLERLGISGTVTSHLLRRRFARV